MNHILVVDDDSGIRAVVRDALTRAGYRVTTAADGTEALESLADASVDLVITDLGMPGMSGHELVVRIRKKTSVPVMLLTVTGDERDKVRLLDAGADDYMVKPFGSEELVARSRALLRRRNPPPADPVCALGDLRIDLSRRMVERNGAEIRLTPTEFSILQTLMERPGGVFTHHQLIAKVWGTVAGVTHDTLRVHVGTLRKKLEADPARPRWIRTEPWVGYRLVRED